MTKHKLITHLLVSSLILLAIACGGGGGESNSSASSQSAEISGSLDFSESSLSKPRHASNDTGSITLVNLITGKEYTITFSDNTFNAEVLPGDYEIRALNNDGKRLRAFIGNVDSENSSNFLTVDIDSTVVAEWMDLYELEISALGNIQNIVSNSANTLVSNSGSYSDNDRHSALIALALKEKLKQDINNNVDIFSSYDPDETSIKTFSNNVLLDIVVSGNQAFLANSQTISDNTGANSFNTANLNFSAPNQFDFSSSFSKEKVLVIGADYSPATGALSIIDASSGNLTQNVQTYPISDLGVFGYRRDVYVMGRNSADFLERYDVGNPGVSLYPSPYSTLASNETSSLNPHGLIFKSKSEAIITRYGSNLQWLVNPRATTESSFFQKSIDLGHYDSFDSIPEFSQGVSVSDNYYLAAQRLENYLPAKNAYLAVIDASGNEINTGTSNSDNLLGIELPARNPGKVIYNKSLGKIFVQCIGQYGSSWSNSNREFTGGIVTIDPHSFTATLLVDDDNGANLSTNTLTGGGSYDGLISDMAIVDDDTGYLVIYDSWQNSDLRTFNPSTGDVGSVISGFEGVGISDIEVDSQNRLWILLASSSESVVKVVETTNNTVEKTISGFDVPPRSLDIIRY